MSDYPQYPTDPADAGGRAPVAGPRPDSVDLAIKLIWAGVAVSLLSTVVTFVLLDTIVDQAFEDAGVSSTIDADTLRSGAIVGAVIGAIIGVAIAALLAHFIGKGANWARIVYTVLAGLGIVLGVFGLGSQPALLLLLSLISLALSVATLFLLYKAESNAWFRAS